MRTNRAKTASRFLALFRSKSARTHVTPEGSKKEPSLTLGCKADRKETFRNFFRDICRGHARFISFVSPLESTPSDPRLSIVKISEEGRDSSHSSGKPLSSVRALSDYITVPFVTTHRQPRPGLRLTIARLDTGRNVRS